MTVEDEDRILFEFLSDKNLQTDSDYDALDAKFSQIIALNGLILSIILFSADDAKCWQIFCLGIICIFVSIIIGIYSYCPKDFEDGFEYFYPKVRPTTDITDSPTLKNIKDFNKSLLNSTVKNLNINDKKASLFNYVLYFLLGGLFFVAIGYYIQLL